MTKEKTIETSSIIKKLQNSYEKNVKQINEENKNVESYILVSLIEAEKIWLILQVLQTTNPEKFAQMKDDEKINTIQKDFPDFYKNFPIVSRYMICMGQYKRKAFKKLLLKCKNTKSVEGKESNEDLWIERQADYVKYLWEEYQTKHFTVKESNAVWDQAHKALVKEFTDFRNLHKSAEEKIKLDKLQYKAELLKEMNDRISSGKQILEEKDCKKLKIELQNTLYKQRFRKTMQLLKKNIKVVPFSSQGTGTNEGKKQEYDEELKRFEYKKNGTKLDMSKLMV